MEADQLPEQRSVAVSPLVVWIQVVAPSAIDPLSAIDTISIRDTTINMGFGVEAIVACGEIAVHGGR